MWLEAEVYLEECLDMGLVDHDLPRVDKLQQCRQHLGTDVAVLLDPDYGDGGVVGAERVNVAGEGADDHLVHREDIGTAMNLDEIIDFGVKSTTRVRPSRALIKRRRVNTDCCMLRNFDNLERMEDCLLSGIKGLLIEARLWHGKERA